MDTGETATLTQLTESPSGLRWSPDGRTVAFNMLVPDPPPALAVPPRAPPGAEWADPPIMENRFKNTQDGVGYLDFGHTHIFVIPVDGGTPRQITTGDFQHASPAAWTPDGAHLVFSSNRNPDWERDFRNSELYIATVATGEIRALTDRPGPDISPVVSPDGTRIAFGGYEDRVRTYQVRQLRIMNLDGSGYRTITTDLDRSVANPVWAADGSGVYLQYDSEGNGKVAFVSLDGEVQVLAHDLGGTSYGRPYGGGSFSVAQNGAFALNRTRPDMPGELAVGQHRTGALQGLAANPAEGESSATTIITQLNADLLANRTLGAVEEIWWESSYDSRPIQGWIVKPPGFDPARRYPLILEIHGGPVSNYGDRFSAEMQLMAAAGYVVLYANPRGSTSYGEEFGDLLYHNLSRPGLRRPHLGCGCGHCTGLHRRKQPLCHRGQRGWHHDRLDRRQDQSLSRGGGARSPSSTGSARPSPPTTGTATISSRYEGLPWENPDAYWEFSPLSLAGNVETPTMMITGEADLRTPLSESYQLYHALKMRGIDTAVIRLPGASHDNEPPPEPVDGQDCQYCGLV